MIDFFTKWRDIRDQKVFFETVIAQRDEATALFDRGKQILEFKREQLDNYRDILQFVSSNQINFELLGVEAQADVEQLQAVTTDAEVFTHFQDYKRLKKALNARISGKRDDLLKHVRTAYEQLYERIGSIAADKEVEASEVLPDLENEMFKIKQSNLRLDQLQNQLDTSELYVQYVEKINKIVAARQPQPQPQPGPGPQPTPQPQPQPKKMKVIKLDTMIHQALKNEGDVDLYLARLKAQLMQHINNNEEILIK